MTTRKHPYRALLVLALALAMALSGCGNKAAEEEKKPNLMLDYASESVIATDPETLSKAYQEEMEKMGDEAIALHYSYEAVSSDGVNFQCELGNSYLNKHDLFIMLYGDEELQDELYVSGLLKPGTALNSVTLNHPLPPGVNTVNCAFTTIVVEEGEQRMLNQALVTIDFIVTE